jgi:ribosomal protein S18 acetylase RimI-like enzyme
MQMSKVVIREARQEDARFIGWVLLAATRSHMPRGWFDIALGLDEAGRLAFTTQLARAVTRSWWHYSNFLVAETNGVPAAALSAFRAGDGYPPSQAAMNEVAVQQGWSETEIGAMWGRSAYLFTCTIAAGDDVWAIENVATTETHRGLGIASALIDRALETGRARGFKESQITMFIGNVGARRAYERAGFGVVDERRSAEFERACGVPGLWCLRRTL